MSGNGTVVLSGDGSSSNCEAGSMKSKGSSLAMAGLALTTMWAAPAAAQYYPYPSQRGGVAGQIERGASAAAKAVGTIAQALRGTRESISVGACQIRAARFGNAQVTDVQPKGRRSLLVRGFIQPNTSYGAWGTRYERAYQPRSFTCTVRDNGEVRKFKTKRLRR